MARIQRDEEVIFFPTPAWLSDDGAAWVAEVHGWIFEPETRDLLRRVLLLQMKQRLGIEAPEQSARFERRAMWFLVDNERGKQIHIRCCGEEFTLGPSARDGHFGGTLRLPRTRAEDAARGGRLEFEAVVPEGDGRRFRGALHLIPPSGVSVISDIDDTVKVTHAHDVPRAVQQTLIHAFEAVPGMAARYHRWASQGAAFHFVSASPWQLYPLLDEFLAEAGFPTATYHMQRFRLKDFSALNLLAPPEQTKPALIKPLLNRYPARRFILVGDCGQHDPEIYAALARQYAGRVARVYLRALPGMDVARARWEKTFAGVPSEQWTIFADPAPLPDLDELPL